MNGTIDEFDLFQEDILKKLLKDVDFFQKCMATNYYFAAKKFRCDVELSEHRLRETWEFWAADLERLLKNETDDKTLELDEFKQCAFLTFWLRRHQPIKNLRRQKLVENEFKPAKEILQRWFSRYGNDFGAIEIGSTICLNYCASSIDEAITNVGDDHRLPQLRSKKNYLMLFKRRKDFWADFSMTMKHKNSSPHAITLIYEALFGFSLPPVRKRDLKSGRV